MSEEQLYLCLGCIREGADEPFVGTGDEVHSHFSDTHDVVKPVKTPTDEEA